MKMYFKKLTIKLLYLKIFISVTLKYTHIHTGVPRFITFDFPASCRYDTFTGEGLWHPCVEQVCGHNSSNNIHLFQVTVSHFGNSCNIPNVAISIIFLRWSVVSDL